MPKFLACCCDLYFIVGWLHHTQSHIYNWKVTETECIVSFPGCHDTNKSNIFRPKSKVILKHIFFKALTSFTDLMFKSFSGLCTTAANWLRHMPHKGNDCGSNPTADLCCIHGHTLPLFTVISQLSLAIKCPKNIWERMKSSATTLNWLTHESINKVKLIIN